MAKTIFNTTEKSNFILNMKTKDYQKYLLRILLGLAVLMPLFCLPLEFFRVNSVYGMVLSIIGVFAMVFVLIGFMKKVTPRALFLPAGLYAGILVCALISSILSFYYDVSLFGLDGRSEGLLSLLFYGCFFLLGAQLGTTDNLKKLLNGLLCMGLANCVWGFFQALPLGLGHYQHLEPMLAFRTFLPSGLAGSPIFLASLLLLLLFPAIFGAILEENKKMRLFYLVCTAVFLVMTLKTQCRLGLMGSVLAAAITIVVVLRFCRNKRGFAALAVVLAAFAAGFLWLFFSPAINGTYSRMTAEEVAVENGVHLYDGGIIWDDSSYRLSASGYYVQTSLNPNGDFNILDMQETYQFMDRVTLDAIAQYPLTGTGPDNLIFAQLYQSYDLMSNPNTFDRCYDFYLHFAATLGLPALLLLAALVVVVFWQRCRTLRTATTPKNWVHRGLLTGVAFFLGMLCFTSSAVTVTPFFWILFGTLLVKEEN